MALTVATIDAVIEDIANNGQSTTQDGTTYTNADLGKLTDIRNELQLEEGRTSGTRPLLRGMAFNNMGYSGT